MSEMIQRKQMGTTDKMSSQRILQKRTDQP